MIHFSGGLNAYRCMTQAVDEIASEPSVREHLLGAFNRLALHMRNQPDPA